MVGVIDVGDLGFADLGFGGAGVVEELVDLMGADVAEDAAVLYGVPEPVGAAAASASVAVALNDLVRGDVDGLDDAADGSGLDEPRLP